MEILMNEWHNMMLRSQNDSFEIWKIKVSINLKFIYDKIKLGKEKKNKLNELTNQIHDI